MNELNENLDTQVENIIKTLTQIEANYLLVSQDGYMIEIKKIEDD